LSKSAPTTATEPAEPGHMAAALALARRGVGQVAPNPAVGCVLVKAGRVVGRGWTQPGGRPHAETEALGRAGTAARGATAYVTLEPCAHHGKTPPCAEALIAGRIARCVVALEDPDPRVAGKGLEMLRAAGIAVDLGLLESAAAELNAGYLLRQGSGRPRVTLKLATTLDGRTAMASGESRWITGPAARHWAHRLRAESDAVLVGGGTALADDPRLDVRLPGLAARSPLRVVLDGRLRLPATHDLMARARAQATCLVTRPGGDRAKLSAYKDCGVELIEVPDDAAGRLSLPATLAALAKRGVNELLVEGGGRVAAALLQEDLVDRLIWSRAPKVIGGEGLPAVAELGLESLDLAPRFARIAAVPVGDDLVETYRRLA